MTDPIGKQSLFGYSQLKGANGFEKVQNPKIREQGADTKADLPSDMVTLDQKDAKSLEIPGAVQWHTGKKPVFGEISLPKSEDSPLVSSGEKNLNGVMDEGDKKITAGEVGLLGGFAGFLSLEYLASFGSGPENHNIDSQGRTINYGDGQKGFHVPEEFLIKQGIMLEGVHESKEADIALVSREGNNIKTINIPQDESSYDKYNAHTLPKMPEPGDKLYQGALAPPLRP